MKYTIEKDFGNNIHVEKYLTRGKQVYVTVTVGVYLKNSIVEMRIKEKVYEKPTMSKLFGIFTNKYSFVNRIARVERKLIKKQSNRIENYVDLQIELNTRRG